MFKREWIYYFARATLAEKPPDHVWPVVAEEDRQKHTEELLSGWEMQIYVFPKRILCAETITDIAVIQRNGLACRVYPPTPLNQKNEASGLFSEMSFPAGTRRVDHQTKISDSAVTGLIIEPKPQENHYYSRALRLDVQSNFPSKSLFDELIDLISVYTQQWWLRLGDDPFSGPLRISADINKDFDVAEELRYHGAKEVHSAWRAVNSTQQLVGFEKSLTPALWRSCLDCVRAGIRAESGILFFTDALACYMAGNDALCILNLALSFEILANKRHFADKKRYISSNDKLQRVSSLVDAENKDRIRAIVIDRDHVAHGRAPYLVGRSPENSIEKYLEAGRSVVNKYLNQLGPGDWPQLSNLDLASTRRRGLSTN